MSKVLVQIGFVKNRKKSQVIKAFINDMELSWNSPECDGMYLTSMKDKHFRGMIWYMCDMDLQDGDVLKLEVSTFLKGVGKDEEQTFESLYYADEEAPVRSIEISDVGMKNYPLVKGKILEIASITEDEKRKADIEDFLNEGF